MLGLWSKIIVKELERVEVCLRISFLDIWLYIPDHNFCSAGYDAGSMAIILVSIQQFNLKSDFLLLYSGFICLRMSCLIKVLRNWILKTKNTSSFIREGSSHPQIPYQRKSVHIISAGPCPTNSYASRTFYPQWMFGGSTLSGRVYRPFSRNQILTQVSVMIVFSLGTGFWSAQITCMISKPVYLGAFSWPSLASCPQVARVSAPTCLQLDCLKPELCLLCIAYTLLALKWES